MGDGVCVCGEDAMLTSHLFPSPFPSLSSTLQENHPFSTLEDFWENTAWHCTPTFQVRALRFGGASPPGGMEQDWAEPLLPP